MEVLCINKDPWPIEVKSPVYGELCIVRDVIVQSGFEDGALVMKRYFVLEGYEAVYNEKFFDSVLESEELKELLPDIILSGDKKLKRGAHGIDFYEYEFYCPACSCMHGFRTKDWPMPAGLEPDKVLQFNENKWTWNKSIYKPTVGNSLRSYRPINKPINSKGWLLREPVFELYCKLYIKEGQLIYSDDCLHRYAGEVLEMLNL